MDFSSISRSEVQKEKKSRWTTLVGKQDSCRSRGNRVNFRPDSRPFHEHGLRVILCREQPRLPFRAISLVHPDFLLSRGSRDAPTRGTSRDFLGSATGG